MYYKCDCSCTNTHTHTHIHAQTRTHTHTHTCTHTHAHTRTLTHTHTHTHTHACTHAHTQRLLEVAKTRHLSYSSRPDSLSSLAERVRVHLALTNISLTSHLSALEEELAVPGVAGLVVVDSVAAPIRREYGTQSRATATERAAVLSRHAARLK